MAFWKLLKKGVYVSQYKWNAYITSNIHWQNYIGNSMSKSNQFYIQRINELEFNPNIIRLGTGELSPKLIPNHLFKEIISNSISDSIQTNYEEPKGKLSLRLEVVNYMKKGESYVMWITYVSLQVLFKD